MKSAFRVAVQSLGQIKLRFVAIGLAVFLTAVAQA